MTINEKPVGKRPGYAAQAVKIVATLIAAGLAGAGLIYLGNQIDGVLRWVCFITGGALLIGGLLYGGALQGEVQRKLGPLPIGKSDQNLKSMPLYQGKKLPE